MRAKLIAQKKALLTMNQFQPKRCQKHTSLNKIHDQGQDKMCWTREESSRI